MALATKCPHCNTIFRVAADQLKLRGGIVRCGSCQEVFDGNAALLDHGAAAAPFSTPAPASLPLPDVSDVSDVSDLAAMAAPAPAAPDENAFALDFDSSYDPFGTLPEHAQLAQLKAEPGPEPELAHQNDFDAPDDQPATGDGRREPWFDAPGDTQDDATDDAPEHYIASALADDPYRGEDEDGYRDENEQVGAPHGAAAAPTSGADTAAGRAPEDADAVEPASETELDEPAFVKQSRRRQRTGELLRMSMAAGSAALLLALLAQGVSTFRNQLAAQFPPFKPALVSICGMLGCRVELPAQLDMVSIEQGELQTLSERRFSYATVLHNQSGTAQAWPSIELVLNDAADQPVLRRVIAPREYLPPALDLGKGFAPRSEQAVKLYFELAQLKASGYHIAVFYP